MNETKNFRAVIAGLLLIAGWLTQPWTVPRAAGDQPPPLSSHQQLVRDILKELIEINTTDSSGDTTRAAAALAARLKAAGFPAADVQVVGPHPRKGNLIARLGGAGAHKPLLLLAHLDVVEARREDWSFDPFQFIERDGYFYGRGSSDNKAGAAVLVAALIRYKQENFTPGRDLILALTADEEASDTRFNGVAWLLQNHRGLIDAAYCINTDAGDGQLKNGRRALSTVQASEKVYQSFVLEVKNPGGHSSIPVKDNAIYHLAAGLTRLAPFEFPIRLNEVTRRYFERMSTLETGPTAADMRAITKRPLDVAAARRLAASPYYDALLRTTCVATRLEAGHADNALPQSARAVVNCRMLPGDSPAEVRQTLVRALADDQISVAPVGTATASPPSPLTPEVLRPIERIAGELWPGVPVIPVMDTGATDGLYLRRAGIPTYGVSGLFLDIDDVRAHGKDERIGVAAFYDSAEFMYRLIKALSSGK